MTLRIEASRLRAAALLLGLAFSAPLDAEVVVRAAAPDAVRPLPGRAGPADPPVGKRDLPQTTLIVPFYEVDTTSPGGTTTLFAVRNTEAARVDVEIRYQAPDGTPLHLEVETLDLRETLTRNLRDVAGLPVDPDGFTRGFVVVVQTSVTTRSLLVGDYFQVDVDDAFATGERMMSPDDLCRLAEVRALDFGSGTELHFLLEAPQGSDPVNDPASVQVQVFDEGGVERPPPLLIYSDEFSFELSASDLSGLAFGTLVFEFAGGGGHVYAEYSADGLFSVGLDGACLLP